MKPLVIFGVVLWGLGAQANEPFTLSQPLAPPDYRLGNDPTPSIDPSTGLPQGWTNASALALTNTLSSNQWAWRTNRDLLRKIYEAHKRWLQTNALKPGLYETRPYTMIVQVPERHPDDSMIFPREGRVPMRIKTPKLELVPRAPVAPRSETQGK